MTRIRMPRRRHRLATQAVELGLAVPQVVLRRMTRMALAGSSPTLADREEFTRMTAEKVAAFYESWNAMFVAAWRANLQLFLSAQPWTVAPRNRRGPRRRTHGATARRIALDVLAEGAAPIHRRVVANEKRLRRR